MIGYHELLFRLVLAAILASIVGLERERLNWAAGLRTHMLVGLGACLFMTVSLFGFMDVLSHPQIELDPSRVAAQVVSGVGFLGAGTIILRRNVVRGLTTAASLWAVAAVGLAVGGGLYVAALVTTVLIVLILGWIKPIELRLFQNRRAGFLKLVIERELSLMEIEAALEASKLRVEQIIVRPGDSPELYRIEVVAGHAEKRAMLALVEALRALPGVREVSYSSWP